MSGTTDLPDMYGAPDVVAPSTAPPTSGAVRDGLTVPSMARFAALEGRVVQQEQAIRRMGQQIAALTAQLRGQSVRARESMRRGVTAAAPSSDEGY